jgi:Kdo2-lipid IVA lauroyltransferase/acyltransferase
MRIGLFQPKYWPTWIGLGVLRSISLMPFAAQRRVGEALGLLIRRLPLSYVRIARRNIELCMPNLSCEQREDLLDLHCRSLGLALCETATTFWSSDARVRELGEIVGLEHIQAALKLGRGAILIGGHFTTLEITTRILGTVMPLNVVFRPTKNALLAHTMYSSFCRHGKPIAHDDIRAMVRALKRNEAVWYAPDQSYRNKGAEMVKFFGIPAATNTATSRLARISGAPVMTYFPERLPTGKYRINIGEPFADFPGPDVIQDAQRFHALLEKQILKYPEQYLWMHRRFKGLSADYPDYYGRDSRRRGPAPAQSNN